MEITGKDVEHAADLARLELSGHDKELFTRQLNAILQYMEQLNQLDTSHVVPTSHVMPLYNVMREDVIRPTLTLPQVMLNAPDQQDGQFRVPAVLEDI